MPPSLLPVSQRALLTHALLSSFTSMSSASSTRSVLTLSAPAKINLALAVAPPSPDPAHAGKHPIASWMMPISLADDLTLTRLPDDYFSRYAVFWAEDALVHGARREIDWSISKDLAVRAHRSLEAYTGRALPIQLKLAKRIPAGSGLGGGSSDAAATLIACDLLFDLHLSQAELLALAAALGSDVPFFIHRAAALIEGMGDQVTLLGGTDGTASDPLHAVLCIPDFPCPTGPVYREFDALPAPPAHPALDFAARVEAIRALASIRAPLDPAAPFNDLAAAAQAYEPRLAERMREAAAIAERPDHLTGSGSAFFALCDDPLHAEFLARAVAGRVPDTLAHPITLARHIPAAPARSHVAH